MRIINAEFTIVSVPYTHTENSSQVNRDGVTDVIVKLSTDNGLTGWGESCSGANVESILETLNAFKPIIINRDPWNREALWHDGYDGGIWRYRESSFNFAWAGIDMALWDLCGKQCGQPLYRLLGGLRRRTVNYFCYLSYGDDIDRLTEECEAGVAAGYTVFYRKVGVDIDRETEAMARIREIIGPQCKIRIDANEAWTVAEAVRYLDRLDRWDIDFAEQPVTADPRANMRELKNKTRVPLAANEGLWRSADAWQVIKERTCDVLCFSPYWVGTLGNFHRLAHMAALEGLNVCKHTHGELGIAAAASHQVLLTLPRIVAGHQQTASMMADDILSQPLPLAQQPDWGVPPGVGLGIEVDQDQLQRYHQHYQKHGQYLPYDPGNMGAEEPVSD